GKYAGIEVFHRLLMDCPEALVVDHINGNPSDNRRENLRICSQSDNLCNRKLHSNNSSGYRGVYFDASGSSSRPWRAQIRKYGKKICLGRFASAEEANEIRQMAEIGLFGEFSPLLSRGEEKT
ncbi:MAG: HNH endonuclease signature motif containing protein, partial [Alcanivorax sp.]